MATTKRILGIDYGSKRIGVAVSDPLNIIARGVRVLENSRRLMDEIRTVVAEYDPAAVVVGMPLTLGGEMGAKAKEVEAFIVRLEREIGIPVIRIDERFTSEEAHETLREMGVKMMKRRSKSAIDLMAASLILQRYLDGHRNELS